MDRKFYPIRQIAGQAPQVSASQVEALAREVEKLSRIYGVDPVKVDVNTAGIIISLNEDTSPSAIPILLGGQSGTAYEWQQGQGYTSGSTDVAVNGISGTIAWQPAFEANLTSGLVSGTVAYAYPWYLDDTLGQTYVFFDPASSSPSSSSLNVIDFNSSGTAFSGTIISGVGTINLDVSTGLVASGTSGAGSAFVSLQPTTYSGWGVVNTNLSGQIFGIGPKNIVGPVTFGNAALLNGGFTQGLWSGTPCVVIDTLASGNPAYSGVWSYSLVLNGPLLVDYTNYPYAAPPIAPNQDVFAVPPSQICGGLAVVGVGGADSAVGPALVVANTNDFGSSYTWANVSGAHQTILVDGGILATSPIMQLTATVGGPSAGSFDVGVTQTVAGYGTGVYLGLASDPNTELPDGCVTFVAGNYSGYSSGGVLYLYGAPSSVAPVGSGIIGALVLNNGASTEFGGNMVSYAVQPGSSSQPLVGAWGQANPGATIYVAGGLITGFTSGGSTGITAVSGSSAGGIAATITGSTVSLSIASGGVQSGMIGSGVVHGGNIASGTITGGVGGQISSGTVTGGNIASGTITGGVGGQISSGTVTGGNIASGTITGGVGGQISSGTVTGGNIASGTITGGVGGQISSGTVTGGNIASGTITGGVGGQISSGTVTGGNIASGTITGGVGGQISSGTVTGGNIASGTITAINLGSGSIVSGKIASGAISLLAGAGIIVSGQGTNVWTISNTQPNKDECEAATVTTLAAYTYNNVATPPSGVGATITFTVPAVLVLDGYTPNLGDRILIKNETGGNAPYNGIYTVTTLGTLSVNGVLTRAIDFDDPGDGINGAITFIQNGSVNAGTSWYCSTYGSIDFSVTNINFSQYAGPGLAAGGALAGTYPNPSIASGLINISNTCSGFITGQSGIVVATSLSGYLISASGLVVLGQSGAVTSGMIASGQVGRYALASGVIVSGYLGSGALSVAAGAGISIALGGNNTWTVTNTSGTGAGGGLTSGVVTSGYLATLSGSQAVNSGTISIGAVVGSDVLGANSNIASGSIGSADLGLNVVQSGNLTTTSGSKAVNFNTISIGAIVGGQSLGSRSLIASGSLGGYDYGLNTVSGSIIAQGVETNYLAGFDLAWLSGQGVSVGSTNPYWQSLGYAGVCRDSTDQTTIVLPTPQNLRINANQAVQGQDAYSPATVNCVQSGLQTVTGSGTTFTQWFQPRAATAAAQSGGTLLNPTIASTGNAVTGSGTQFENDLQPNDLVGISGIGWYQVASITNNTSLTLGITPSTAFTSQSGFTVIEQPGLYLGTGSIGQVTSITTDTNLTVAISGTASGIARIGASYGGCTQNVWVGQGQSGTSTWVSTQRTKPFVSGLAATGYGAYYRNVGYLPLESGQVKVAQFSGTVITASGVLGSGTVVGQQGGGYIISSGSIGANDVGAQSLQAYNLNTGTIGGYIYGCQIAYSAGIGVQVGNVGPYWTNLGYAGICRDSTDSVNITLTSQSPVQATNNSTINGNDSFVGTGTISQSGHGVAGASTTFITSYQPRAPIGTSPSIAWSGTNINGSGCLFLTDVAIGDLIGASGGSSGFVQITNVSGDTQVTTAFSGGSFPAGTVFQIIEQPTFNAIGSGTSNVTMILSHNSMQVSRSGSIAVGASYRCGSTVNDIISGTYTSYYNYYVGMGLSGTGPWASTQRTFPYGITGYDTYYRRIGCVPANLAGNAIAQFTQRGTGTRREYSLIQSSGQILASGENITQTTIQGWQQGYVVPPTADEVVLQVQSFAKGNTITTTITSQDGNTSQQLQVNQSGNVATMNCTLPFNTSQFVTYSNSNSGSTNVYVVGYVENL